MTDQDLDGSHVNKLCINLFYSQWNELIHINNFLGFMNTPIKTERQKRTRIL